jgi:hypothetical protein
VRGSVRRHSLMTPVFNAETSCNIVSKGREDAVALFGVGGSQFAIFSSL